MKEKTLNIGIIGYGFMGRAHSHAYRTVPHFFQAPLRPILKAVCGRDLARAQFFAKTWGFESVETDWRKLVERPDIDAVDICAPNHLHKAIAVAAAASGKMVFCEKPLALNLEEAEAMCKAVEAAGTINTVWYNYRFLPAVKLAKSLVAQGLLGRIFHYRAAFLQDWAIPADLPQGGEMLWRLEKASAGSGVLGDLLSHSIDGALWLNGNITGVTAMTQTFIPQRRHALTGKNQPVEIDDACAFLARFANGSLGIFESTRYARGHQALYTFELNGELGSLLWNLEELNHLRLYDLSGPPDTQGWRDIHVTERNHPYMEAWWMPGLQIGYEHSFAHQAADLFQSIANGTSLAPTFRDAFQTQQVCEAVAASAKKGEWLQIS